MQAIGRSAGKPKARAVVWGRIREVPSSSAKVAMASGWVKAWTLVVQKTHVPGPRAGDMAAIMEWVALMGVVMGAFGCETGALMWSGAIRLQGLA